MSALTVTGLVVASMASLLHMVFFVLESVLFRTPGVRRLFGVRPDADSAPLRLFAVNQGLYNLALAVAVLVGVVVAIAAPVSNLGVIVVLTGCAVMVVAGIALAVTAPRRTLPIALAQGGLPALAIIALLVG